MQERHSQVFQISDQEADEELISLYASREKIYPRSVSGLFFNWRWGLVFLTGWCFMAWPGYSGSSARQSRLTW